jgi:hypothetical protein
MFAGDAGRGSRSRIAVIPPNTTIATAAISTDLVMRGEV